MFLSGLLILILSFVPMLLYALVLWWLDRYEKEPFGLLSVAFLWGAVPSIVLALIMQIVLDVPLTAIQSSSQLTYELLGASVVAPLTEEGIKALALILLLLLFKREIDSPLDGVIYGGMVGFGFAAVENVFYLFGALTEGGIGEVLGLAFMRAGIFGLNHAMYTGFTGLGVAMFLEIRNKALRFIPLVLGFLMSLGAHALHNALATLTGVGGAGALVAAVLVDWVGVIVLFAVAVGTFFVERQRILAYTDILVRGRVIPESEVAVLKSTFQRRMARLDLLLRGDVRRWWALQRYHQKVTEAAFAWHRLGQGDTAAQPRLVRLEQEFKAFRLEAAPGAD